MTKPPRHLEARSSAQDSSTDRGRKVVLTVAGGTVQRSTDLVANAFAGRAERHERTIDQRTVVATLAASKDGFSVGDRSEFDEQVAILQGLRQPSSAEQSLADLVEVDVDVDRSELDHKSWSVQTRMDGAPRTFVVESNAIPQFPLLLPVLSLSCP